VQAKLQHQNVVRILDCGATVDGRPYLVLERLDGQTLADALDDTSAGYLPVERALDVAWQALCGLGHVHERKLVHRDVKPSNLFLCSNGVVKVLDFGVAKMLVALTGVVPLAKPTQRGAAVGTPKFMAPEQVRGRTIDSRADLYAMGVVLYLMVTGATPFQHHTEPADLLRAHLTEEPRPPSTVARQPIAAALDDVILRALAKDPDDRFRTAEEFASAIAVLRRAGPPAPMPLPSREPEPATEPTRPSAAAVVETAVGASAADGPTIVAAPELRLAVRDGAAHDAARGESSLGAISAPSRGTNAWLDRGGKVVLALSFSVGLLLTLAVGMLAKGWP
jgi:serine/threonine-protein kinase